MNKSSLVPKKVTDKNGKATTVYVNPDQDAALSDKQRALGVAKSRSVEIGDMDPPEIDGILGELHGQRFDAMLRKERLEQTVQRLQEFRYGQDLIPQKQAEIAELDEEMNRLVSEMTPYNEEFTNAGGWNRAFLVTGSANGHVHSSMSCSTCRPTTQYAWMTDYSGSSEEEIVDAAGERACTVCYPSAPVETLSQPSRMVDPEEEERRQEREARREQLARERDAKGIWNEDGSDVVIDGYHYKTETSVEREAVDLFASERDFTNYAYQYEDMRRADPNSSLPNFGEYLEGKRDMIESKRAMAEELAKALAFKRGETIEDTISALEEKAEKKFRRDWNLKKGDETPPSARTFL